MTRRSIPVLPTRQDGVVLAVVLILLLVMTLIGLVSMRGTLMEQRMSTAQMDRSLAFQAAEAALREGEAVAASDPTAPAAGCVNGICAAPLPTATARWLDPNWTTMSRQAVVSMGANTPRPRFIVEVMEKKSLASPECTTSGDVSPDAICSDRESRYRITARSTAADRADVILQSSFAAP